MRTDNNIVFEKSKRFALRIVRLYKYLCKEHKEYVLSKQVLRSGTSIGANIAEAIRGRSKPDFYSKMNISLQEASETAYWIDLLYSGEYISENVYRVLSEDCEELIRLLTAITKTQNALG